MAESREIVKLVNKAIEEKKAENIKILDISELTVISDYFVICNGNSGPQIDAITDNVIDTLAKAGVHSKRIEGKNNSGWILMDYGDVVVHVFSKEERQFYDLERIWRDARLIDADTM